VFGVVLYLINPKRKKERKLYVFKYQCGSVSSPLLNSSLFFFSNMNSSLFYTFFFCGAVLYILLPPSVPNVPRKKVKKLTI